MRASFPVETLWARLGRKRVSSWYHPDYRLPFTTLESASGMDVRRVDFAAWYLVNRGFIRRADIESPTRVTYRDLERVHDGAYLESLSQAEVLAHIFGVDPADVLVDEVLGSIRLAVGGTIAAARAARAHRKPTFNMLGGFHHASPAHGAGLCALNDVAVALAVLRAEGLDGQVVIIDLDAHPPNGTAACLSTDPKTWIGSISGCDWGAMDRVDETVLPPNTGDATYLVALSALLGRMPAGDFAFVLAGGDVLEGDHLGQLGLTVDGARRRDLAVLAALKHTPSVWLSGGGYHRDAWKVLAGTGIALAAHSLLPIPANFDPLRHQFSKISKEMDRSTLAGEALLTERDLEEALGVRRPARPRLVGFYTREGVEYALSRYGILGHIQRIGYTDFRVVLDRASCGDRFRLLARAADKRSAPPRSNARAAPRAAPAEEHLLVECVLQKRFVAGSDMLFVHWLTLRNPRVAFDSRRPRLPGQEMPGLGLAREAGQMLAQIARRLELAGVVFRPAFYHVAYTSRYHFRFIDPLRQGRFEALQRDLAGMSLLEATTAIAERRVFLGDAVYGWEPDDMAHRFVDDPDYEPRVIDGREQSHFSLRPEPHRA
jgi:acetoin utilization deacetylase AcuC-like enzyme